MPKGYEMVTGTVTGDGSIKTLTIGFKPRFFRWINLTDGIEYTKEINMADADCLLRIANGTGSKDANSLLVLSNTGVTIAAAAFVNAKVYHYAAFN